MDGAGSREGPPKAPLLGVSLSKHVKEGSSSEYHNALARRARELRVAQTPAEERLWQAIRRGKVGGRRFRRQKVLGPFIVDFFCPSERLIIEVDGAIHDGQRAKDEERQHILETMGFRVIRFTNAQVLEACEGVVLAIQEALGGD